MDLAESAQYLRHHLALVGRTDPLIADDAIARLHKASLGLPRALNNVAVAALIAAATAGKARSTTTVPKRRSLSSRATNSTTPQSPTGLVAPMRRVPVNHPNPLAVHHQLHARRTPPIRHRRVPPFRVQSPAAANTSLWQE